MSERSKSGRLGIAILEPRSQKEAMGRAGSRAWSTLDVAPGAPFDDGLFNDERFAGWMSADEIIDDLMLELDDEEFWQIPLPSKSVRH